MFNVKDEDIKILGEIGEKVAREITKREGWYVLPASLSGSSKAAMFDSLNEKIILPDNFESKNGLSRWLEIKTKTVASFSTKDKEWEHGLPLRHWNSYMQIQKKSGVPGFLGIIELNPDPSFLINSLNNLQSGHNRISWMQGEQHIFIPRKKFKIHKIENIEIPKGLSPEAKSTLNDIESGKYNELNRNK